MTDTSLDIVLKVDGFLKESSLSEEERANVLHLVRAMVDVDQNAVDMLLTPYDQPKRELLEQAVVLLDQANIEMENNLLENGNSAQLAWLTQYIESKDHTTAEMLKGLLASAKSKLQTNTSNVSEK